MKAILINAADKTVTEVQVSKENTLKDWYRLMGVDIVETAMYLPKRDTLLVDEEGLFKSNNQFFTLEGGHQPFSGNGLIVGGTPNGNSTDCKITVEEVKAKVKFMTAWEAMQSLKH